MKKTIIFLFAAMLGLATQVDAQYREAPNAFAFRWTKSNFQYPYSKELHYEEYTSGAELMYVRHLGKPFNLAFPIKIMKAELPLDDQGTEGPSVWVGSFDMLLHLKLFQRDNFIYPYLLGGAGLMAEMDNNWKINPEYPVGLGLNFRLGRHVYLSVESQYRFDTKDNRDYLQHAAGLWVILGKYDKAPKISDSDKDGVPDTEDQCPNEVGAAAMFGCPDTDGDGVANRSDKCPDQAGIAEMSGCPDRDGDGVADHLDACPDQAGVATKLGCPETDKDGDGVADAVDKCPDQAGTALAGGCPDSDTDGVADADDKCPSVAGLPAFNGCPDTDRDGVPDSEDKCPNSAGNAANNGCPEIKAEVKAVFDRALTDVQFETGKSILLTSSYVVLDEIVGIMTTYPDHKLRIAGHTDSIGEAPANQTLSEQRAKAAYDYLVAKGVSPGRLSYQGFGESKPVADNMYAPGRAKNRRVEFSIYVQ